MNYKVLLKIIYLIVFTQCIVYAFNSNRIGGHNDYPQTLNANNFDSYVYNQDTATLVEFYSSYCGYCKRLAPRYKTFADTVRRWMPVVRIAKVNCENIENVELCRAHKSSTFPTFRFFGPNHSPDINGTHIPIENSDKLNTPLMEAMTVKELLDIVGEREQPKQWPKLKTIKATDKSSLFDGLQSSHFKSLFIVIESSDYKIGVKVALDLSEHVDHVDVRNAEVSSDLMNLFQEGSSLTLIHVKNVNSKTYEVIKSYEFDPEWTPEEKALKIEDMRKCMVSIITNNYLKHKELESEQPLTKVDLYNGIRHSLYHNIALRQYLEVNEMNVLRQFLILLLKYFPFQEKSHRDDIHRMSVWLNNRSIENSAMYIDEYDDEMKKFNSLPPERPYIKCKGSTPDLRAYPCSLWSLFHMLTVAEYRHLSVNEGEHEVLYVMRDFIGTFFTCRYCARHFWNMSSPLLMDEKPTDVNSSVLWLWSGHNKVNKRLQCDLSEDPASPKMQYPTHASCPNCRYDNEEWNKTAVLEYLVNYYSVENIVNSAIRVTSFNFIIIFILISMLFTLTNNL